VRAVRGEGGNDATKLFAGKYCLCMFMYEPHTGDSL
jgi:hypothetical protein